MRMIQTEQSLEKIAILLDVGMQIGCHRPMRSIFSMFPMPRAWVAAVFFCGFPHILPGAVAPGIVWETWDVDARRMDLADVAWNGGSRLAAVGDNGVVRISGDHGSTWTTKATEGVFFDLKAIAWDGNRFLAVGGASPDTCLILESGSGNFWSPTCLCGHPGLRGIATTPSWAVAVGDAGMAARSGDFPAWDVPDTPVSTRALADVVWTGRRFVAAGAGGVVATSPDGVGWTRQSSGLDPKVDLKALAWDGTRLIAVGVEHNLPPPLGQGDKPTLVVSDSDGENWTSVPMPPTWHFGLNAIAATGECFVAMGDYGHVVRIAGTSTSHYQISDGIHARGMCWDGSWLIAVGDGGGVMRASGATPGEDDWEVTLPDDAPASLNDIADPGDGFPVAVGDGGVVRSVMGSFTPRLVAAPDNLYGIAAARSFPRRLVAVGAGGRIIISPNEGWDWTDQISGTTRTLRAVDFGSVESGSFFIAVGDNGTILQSQTSSGTWLARTSPTAESLRGVAFGYVAQAAPGGDRKRIVAVGDDTAIIYSEDGETWVAAASLPVSETLRAVVRMYTGFVAVGSHGMIATSEDCANWAIRQSGTGADLRDVAWQGGQLVAVGDGGVILTSPDGIVWTRRHAPGSMDLHAVTSYDTRNLGYVTRHFAAVGSRGEAIFSHPGGWFGQWLANQHPPAGEDGPDDDPNSDGIPNLLAYALDIPAVGPSDAGDFASMLRFQPPGPSRRMVVRLRPRDFPVGDIAYIIETTTDPASAWSEVIRYEPGQWFGSGSGSVQKASFHRDRFFALPENVGGRERCFVRLRVEQRP
jgi:hypothetical protein